MNNQTERLRFLLGLYAEDQASERQVQEMLELLKTIGNSVVLENFILELKDGSHQKHDVDWNKVWREIETATSASAIVYKMEEEIRTHSLWRRIAIAASIILCIGLGSYFLFFNHKKQIEVARTQQERFKNDIPAPTETKAMITLADGRKILLDSVTSGTLVIQGKVQVIKNANGEIVYTGKSEEVAYNTLYNPRGSKVQSLTLSDGTKVWLNAESSLRYPVAFSGKERRVEITGEAYFEVVHKADKPFHVMANGMDIEDVGTAFNINAYSNEPVIKTTLVEGEVKVINGAQTQDLLPGQQSLLDKNGNFSLVKNADVELATAWKNGLTQFKSADIQSIMRQVERWYDVDVVYEGNVPERNFTGGLSREASLSELLKILELSKIHFKIDGKKLMVMP